MYAIEVKLADGPQAGKVIGEFVDGYPQTGSVRAAYPPYPGARWYAEADAQRACEDIEGYFGEDLNGRRRYWFSVVQVDPNTGKGVA